MVRRKAVFLDADYIYYKGQTYARLLLKGKKTVRLLFQYDPYFYADAAEKKDEIARLSVRKNGEVISVKRVEIFEKILRGEKKALLKIFCNKPSDVVVLRSVIPFRCYEHGIHYARRFMLDHAIAPFSVVSYEREGRIIGKILEIRTDESDSTDGEIGKERKGSEADEVALTRLAFDIETYNPLGAPREKKDPAIMISYASSFSSGSEKGVLTYKDAGRDFATACASEAGMLDAFNRKFNELNPDIIYGYNSSNFDLPYLKARAEANKLRMNFGKDKTDFRKIQKGMLSGAKIAGRIHVDIYPVARFFGFTGMIKAQEFTLEKVYSELTGKKKKMVKRLNIWEMWDKGQIGELADYSLGDSEVTYELGERILPLLVELSKLTRMPLFDASLTTSGQLVESLLMFRSQARGEVIPSKPSEAEAMERQKNPIEGAFVKLPEPGIYEDIAVFDFRGLYPSIIISYNIDPDTLVKANGRNGETGGAASISDSGAAPIPDAVREYFESPTGAKFGKGPKGLIPFTLEHLIDLRAGIKNALKKADKESDAYRRLYARSHALKILANSFYGYLGYARSRWYNRSCAESVTAWGRKHILEAAAKAEEQGFRVLYADTDSLFLLLGGKKKQDALAFLDSINRELPEKMELELENFYTRGVFVSKKQGEKGAKKKYAMLAEDGSIKIRGFELVRRDWSKIAKDTQYAVLEAILREGDKDKAVGLVQETIKRLKSGAVPMEELMIFTQLTKHPDDYDLLSPEVAAARKAIARGTPLEKGSVVSYVITKSGKTISERAEISEYAKDYDPDYYINNQILPSVMKILKELGYDEDELKNKGKQQNLGGFFG